MKDIKNRLFFTLTVLLALFTTGVAGYMVIEGWNFFDSLYMTVITLATVGYGETNPLTYPGRVFTVFLILGGIGAMTYIFSSITALLIEGELKDVFRRIKMEHKIEHMKDHYLVCGATHTGLSVCEELTKTRRDFILIVLKEEELKKYLETGYCVVTGDASVDETLLKCNIKSARGVFCTLKNDKDNAFIAISARGLNPALRIITLQRESEPAMREKLLRSGADIVISPFHIGGLRMASEMIRPSTAQFLDRMMRGSTGENYRFEDVPAGEKAAGGKLGKWMRAASGGALVVALKNTINDSYQINPPHDAELTKDDVFVVLGTPEQVAELRGRLS
ncbi:MAG: NAD-binding protein [Elusimicrobia bacterium]|nr:NAD-binding protein [Elusimicrobiota bacterium]